MKLPDDLRTLGYEIDGVIHDVDHGNGCDAVCMRTLRRVRDALLTRQHAPPKDAEPVAYVDQDVLDQLAAGLIEPLAMFRKTPNRISTVPLYTTPAPSADRQSQIATNRRDAESGVALIAVERARQVSAEGWTPEHDDEHKGNELSKAAFAYINFSTFTPSQRDRLRGLRPSNWPWSIEWWKASDDNMPANRIRELVKAGALVAAEIDRLQRAAIARDAQNARKGE